MNKENEFINKPQSDANGFPLTDCKNAKNNF